MPTISETDRFIAAERARTVEFCAECDRLILGCRSLLEQADELLREIRAQLDHGPLCFCVECLGRCATPAPTTWKERQ